MRGHDIGVVFQDPSTTLNPLLPVGRQIVEGEIAHRRLPASAGRDKAVELLREVEIADPENRAEQFPSSSQAACASAP